MYRIRFHGRGGQGIKTASRILGTAFFHEGFQVQDAPRYGAERRGAPIFAYVRADRQPIDERGVIAHPDLVLVADETIVPIPVAGVLAGLDDRAILVIASDMTADSWRERLNLPCRILTQQIPKGEDAAERRHVGVRLAAAAARLSGAIGLDALERAVRDELAALGEQAVAENLDHARAAWAEMADMQGIETPRAAPDAGAYAAPDWIVLAPEDIAHAAPMVRGEATSVEVRTGLWRVFRPVIHLDHCTRCGICMAYCPDGAISADKDGFPVVDYDHCKGCMVCVAQCPVHTIAAVPEAEAREEPDTTGGEVRP